MKFSRQVVYTLIVLVTISALYRLIPGRPLGFAPQFAIGLLGAAMFRTDKKWGYAMPLFSMLISDLLFELFFQAGWVAYGGFYKGQLLNYMMILAVSTLGFGIHKPQAFGRIAAASVASPVLYFLLSNSAVWLGGGGFKRGFTGTGYIQTLVDGLPFLNGSLISTALFSMVLFGGWAIVSQRQALSVKP